MGVRESFVRDNRHKSASFGTLGTEFCAFALAVAGEPCIFRGVAAVDALAVPRGVMPNNPVNRNHFSATRFGSSKLNSIKG